ncbi:unnamed protein product, partial [Brassica rapa]
SSLRRLRILCRRVTRRYLKLIPIEKASIDFAEFFTEADPLIVSLPLKFSNSGAVLNVPKGVGTDSNEGFDLSRMKRPMLRLHNPHLKNKIRGRSRYWKELVLTKVRNTNVQCIWSLMPTLTQELLLQSCFCKDMLGMCYHLCTSGRQR